MQALLVYGGMFASGFTSATLLPGTSEAMLIALISTKQGLVWLLVLSAGLGNVGGSIINWILGKACMRYQDRRWFPVSPAQTIRAQAWFDRYGYWSLLFSWLPVIGDPLTLVAGLAGLPFWRFILLVGIGKFGRYTFIALALVIF